MERRLPRLHVIFPKDGSMCDTTVDIIAVHGIETSSPHTWIAYERESDPRGREVNWLVDENMLHQVVPQARIWAFDYNSRFSDEAQVVRIKDLGGVFLNFIKDKVAELGTRPILFIGSCFGGIVVAQALQRAAQEYEQLLRFTTGVVFLGTPLRGTKGKGAAEWKTFICGIFGQDNESSTTLIEDLAASSSNLESLVEDFGKLTIQYGLDIRCFYETRKTQILKSIISPHFKSLTYFVKILLVDKTSACLDCHEHIPLDVRHSMLNKFRGPEDGSFILVSGRIKEIFDKASTAPHRTPEGRECVQLLASNYMEHKDRNPKRVTGTCEWFLQHPLFHKWRYGDEENLLFISADPGTGKSVLSRALVDEGLLGPGIRDGKIHSICYFFFKDDDADRCSGAPALCAILHQLLTRTPTLVKHAISYFNAYGKKFCDIFGILWKILMDAIADPNTGLVICILDALDECKESARNELIKKLGCFYLARHNTKAKLKFIVSSRPYADIKGEFRATIDDLPAINLKGEEETESISKEIDLVIMHEVPRIAKARDPPLDENIQKGLVKHLKMMNNRTYLWLHLVLDEVRRSLESSEPKLKRLVNKLPHSVNAAYEQILNRITDPDLIGQAKTLLHIVVAAERPLTLKEINVALAIAEKTQYDQACNSVDDLELDAEDAFKIKVRNLCGLFVSIVDSKIYLIHQTAKEFLVKETNVANASNQPKAYPITWRHSITPAESGLLLAKICVSYLLLNDVDDSRAEWMSAKTNLNKSVINQSTQERPFLDYAAIYWTSHFHQVENLLDKSILQNSLDLVSTRSRRFLTWIRVYWTHHSHLNTWDDSDIYNQNFTSLIILSFFGLEMAARLSLELEPDVDAEGIHQMTALHWAAKNGHIAVVQLLLERKADVNRKDFYSFTALHRAAENGHTAVVQLLLKYKADANRRDLYGFNALHKAAESGHVAVAQLLLQCQKDVNMPSSLGITALNLAAQHERILIVQLLLEYKADINAEDVFGRTTLVWAVWNNDIAMLRLLLEHDANVHLQDDLGGTMLHHAVISGCREIVQLILQCKVDVDAEDGMGCTALRWALQKRHISITQLLLDHMVTINVQDSCGRTILHWAVEAEDRAAVQLLLEHKADANIQDIFGRTALQRAVEKEHIALVQLLLEHGADLHLKNMFGETAIDLLVNWRHSDLVQLRRSFTTRSSPEHSPES